MEISFFKKTCLWCILGILPAFLLGCCNTSSSKDASYRVVTHVHVIYKNNMLEAQRILSQPDNLQKMLDYLRSIDPYGKPLENPETVAGSHFYITVFYSDGDFRVYQQKADRFMCIDNGPWKRINPQKALALSHLLGSMTIDPLPEKDSVFSPPLHPQI